MTLTIAPFASVSGQRGWEPPAWVGDLTFGATNALLAGVTAGVVQELRGGSFGDAFATGALGGIVVYGGKRMAAARFPGAGLMGREIAAVGSSVTRNASLGTPPLSELVLPLGPLHVYVRLDEAWKIKASASEVATLLWALTRSELDFDFGRTLSSGSFTFVARNHVFGSQRAIGVALEGVILMNLASPSRTFAHERVHIIQRDFINTVWGLELERILADNIKPVEFITRFVDLNVTTTTLSAFGLLFDLDWGNRPWELEADYLDKR